MEIVFHFIKFLFALSLYYFETFCFYYNTIFIDTTTLHLFIVLGFAMDSRPRRHHGSRIKSVESGNGKW